MLQSFTYTYDKVGNRVKVEESSGRVVEYSYNKVNQLTKEIVTNDPSNINTTTIFTYDKVGNILTKKVANKTTTYTYNSNDQLIQKDNTSYSYDDNGNLIDDSNNTCTYDEKDRLIKVVTPTDTIEYSYDANDNRITKTTSSKTTTYLIDTNTPYAQVITKTKPNGTKVEYTYGNGLINIDRKTLLKDALGSTRAIVDSNQKVTDTYRYKPYGELANHKGDSNINYLFTGEQRDSETNNYYLRARYYNPNIARFLSYDSYNGTMSSPLTQNHYLYTHGNPVNYTDPTGHMTMGLGDLSMMTNIMGSLSGMSIMKIGAVGGSILFQLRANKQYVITLNRDYSQRELHLYIYAEDIEYDNDYRYEVLLGEDLGGFLYKRSKSETHNKSFTRLSPLQFKTWEIIVFYSHPRHPFNDNPNIRAYKYGIPFGNCVTWGIWAKSMAITTMLTVPSL